MTANFETMARARGLILPDCEKAPIPNKKTVVWDGRAMQIVDDGTQLAKAANFTYHSGHKMVGYIETPTTPSTKLIHGEHRAINTPAPTKEGDAWKPGCRYSNRNTKMDNDIEGEPFLSNGKFSAFLTDDDQVNFKSGRVLWQDGRFRNCPGRVGHAQYETMCKSLRDTSQWKDSRPEARFAPGYADYTKRTPEQLASEKAAKRPPPSAPEGSYNIREADGSVTTVPETAALAKNFRNTKLIPAKLGAIPNGFSPFSVHPTSTEDLRWLTRTVAQRTAGNVPIRGPGSVDFFEKCGHRGSTMSAAVSAALHIA